MEKYAKTKGMDPNGITQDEKEKLMEDMMESLYPGDLFSYLSWYSFCDEKT